MDQCLQVFLLSGLFSIRSASSLESTENSHFTSYLILSYLILSCLYLTDTFGTARALSTGEVGAGQHWTLLPLTLGHTVLQRTSENPSRPRERPLHLRRICVERGAVTYITPAVDAFHLPHQGHPRMPVVTVLIIVLAKLAVPRTICLHHVAVLQSGCGLLLLWTLFAAVGGIPPDGMSAGQHRAHNLLAVHLP